LKTNCRSESREALVIIAVSPGYSIVFVDGLFMLTTVNHDFFYYSSTALPNVAAFV